MTASPRLLGLLLLATCLGCTRPAKLPECPPGGLGPAALDRGLLILGELHGTEQAPPVVLATACHAALREGHAWIGLEQPAGDQPQLDAYLAGGDEAALLAGEAWQRPVQDGRNSEAMLALLRRVRELRKQGLKLDVVYFDVPLSESGTRGRDQQMALNLEAAREARPRAPGVVLVGNVHATRRLQLPKSMAWYLGGRGVGYRNLDLASEGGTAWLAGLTGGVSPVGPGGPAPREGDRGFTFEVGDSPRGGFDGWWFGGKLTASAPAVKPAAGGGAKKAH